LAKHLSKFIAVNSVAGEVFSPLKKSCGVQSAALAPNITANIDFKSSQMLGSIKAIYLLVAVDVGAEGATGDECSLFKFKLELKVFLAEIVEYLRGQLLEMGVFVAVYADTSADSGGIENGSERRRERQSQGFIF
jgi:hypothetical protein